MPAHSIGPISQTSTREKILEYLREQRLASVEGLSRQYGLTRADIRYHLNALLAEGMVEMVPRDTSRPAPRGRPQRMYRLSTQEAPDNLAQLCSALLDTLGAGSTDPWQELAARMAERRPASGSAVQRYNETVQYLNQHGYQARWEAHASGPRILLRNCPYAAILAAHPELCELDRVLLGHMTQAPQQQISQINLCGGKPAACVFASLAILSGPEREKS